MPVDQMTSQPDEPPAPTAHDDETALDEEEEHTLLPRQLPKVEHTSPMSRLNQSIALIVAVQTLLALAFCSVVAVLAVFMNEKLGYSEAQASFITNSFNFANFTLAMLGGLLADSLYVYDRDAS